MCTSDRFRCDMRQLAELQDPTACTGIGKIPKLNNLYSHSKIVKIYKSHHRAQFKFFL